MMQLTLANSEKVYENLPKFEQFMRAYDLEIFDRSEERENGTIDLFISVDNFHAAKWVNNLAYDFFEETLKSSRTDYISKQMPQLQEESLQQQAL
jgi:hypothetical protein